MQRTNYKRTIIGCFSGIINQSVCTNVTALLFVPFMTLYDLTLTEVGVLIGINFFAQTLSDIILTFCIGKTSYRTIINISCSLSAVGLLMFGLSGLVVPKAHMYTAIIISTVVFASSSGMLEVTLSPIVDNIPETVGAKGPAMSLMHSFYAWGQVFCILLTAISIIVFGNEAWSYVLMAFAVIPVVTIFIFSGAPLDKKQTNERSTDIFKTLFSPFFICAILAIYAGGVSEIVMNQWVATFVVTSLHFTKATADLVGMCLFAVMMGLGRALYGKFGDKVSINKILVVSSIGSLVLYLLVAIELNPAITLIASILTGFTTCLLWPGTLVAASEKYPRSGAWIFAVLAIAGDVGASTGPILVGSVAESSGFSLAFLIAAIAPLVCLITHSYMLKKRQPIDTK